MRSLLISLLFIACIKVVQAKPVFAKDSIIKVCNLKNNYRLVYKHFDSINYISIEHGNSSIELAEGEADAKMPIETLGCVYADFDSSFAIVTHIDVNPIKVYIYNKSTGGILMYGLTPLYLDTLNGLLMYEGAYGKAGKLILFKAKTGKAEIYDTPTDCSCFGYGCWKVVQVTGDIIRVDYLNRKQESTVRAYIRK